MEAYSLSQKEAELISSHLHRIVKPYGKSYVEHNADGFWVSLSFTCKKYQDAEVLAKAWYNKFLIELHYIDGYRCYIYRNMCKDCFITFTVNYGTYSFE